MTANTAKPVYGLILDAGPIIKNEPPVSTLLQQSEELYTVPAVIEEIRDPVTRSRVETILLPFLKLRTPASASIKAVSDFARRTGDLEVLSRPDIQILALAYELECERNHGDWRLRSVPGQKRLNGAPPVSSTDAPQKVDPVPEDRQPKAEVQPARQREGAWGTVLPVLSEPAQPNTPAESPAKIEEEVDRLSLIGSVQPQSFEESPDPTTEESDEEGWITPSNINKHLEKELGSTESKERQKTMQVATVTTDFAMQNVLLRMNLNLLSLSLQRTKQLKTWILRCYACFNLTKDMNRQFCSRCGKPTLLRTSCSTDKDGNFKVHLKKNMQWNTRGDVYSIPKPVSGSSNGKVVSGGGKGGWGQGLILAEDQKEYVQALTNARRRKNKDLMDEDYLPSILSGDRGGPGSRPKVGAGRNVNSKKRHK